MKNINRIKTIFLSCTVLFTLLNNNQVKAENKTTVSTTTTQAQQEVFKINYLKIDGIEGSSTQKGFEDYLQITSWSTGISTYDKITTVQDFYITLPKSNSSISLFRTLVTSKVIPSMTLVVLDPTTINSNNPKIDFKFVMRNITINNFQMSGYDATANSTAMLDQISFKYESGTYEGGEFDGNKKALPKNSVNFSIPSRGLVP